MIEVVLRIGFSLLVVLMIMWGLARIIRRPMNGRAHGTLAVLTRQQLTRSASVAVVKVADRALVIGVTEGQVTLLAETELTPFLVGAEPDRRPTDQGGTASVVDPTAPAGRLQGSLLSPRTWAQAVEFLRERTARPR